MGMFAMIPEGFFGLVTMPVVADLLGLPTIWTVIIAVYAAFGIGFWGDAIARPLDIALIDFNDSLAGGVCQCIAPDIPRFLTAGAPPKPSNAGAGAVGPAAGDADKVRQLLPGLPQLHRAVGGVGPGGILGQISALVLAHGALFGPLHLGYLVGGVLAAVILDVPRVEGFQALLRPGGRGSQLMEHREKRVTAVPAAQPAAGAVAGGAFKIRVMPAQIIHRAAPVELPALPLGVGRPRPAMGRGLEELHAHLVGAGYLKGVSRSPYEEIGKPEDLKENLSGSWSRRIHWKSRKIARKFLCIFHSFLNNVLVVQ